jgi:hypothetical protein
MPNKQHVSLGDARDRTLHIRALYETLEHRLNGKVWSNHEIMLGFSNDVGYIGRLILARDGTWDIDGDPAAELEHKLAEALWWVFVIADRLDIDMTDAFNSTMDKIQFGLDQVVKE